MCDCSLRYSLGSTRTVMESSTGVSFGGTEGLRTTAPQGFGVPSFGLTRKEQKDQVLVRCEADSSKKKAC